MRLEGMDAREMPDMPMDDDTLLRLPINSVFLSLKAYR